MANGRTIWMPIDVTWMKRELNMRLVLKAGPEAWGVLLNLWLEAKEQRSQDGTVKFGYVSIGQRICVDPDRVEEIVKQAVAVGVLTGLREGLRCEAVLTDFAEDDRRGREAIKKAFQRAGTEGDKGGQDGSLSPDVPNCPPRVEKRRVVTTSVESVGLDGPNAPHGRSASKPERWAAEISELFAFWQQQCGHPHAKLTSDRRTKIRARLSDGYTVEDVRRAIGGAAVAAFVDDRGKRHDDLELICRNGSKLESFMARASKPRRRAGSAFTIEQKRRDAGMCIGCGKREPGKGSELCEGCEA